MMPAPPHGIRCRVDYTLYSALLLGLFSTVHCVVMCGGIMGALALSLPAEVRAQPLRLALYLAAYNTGRLASYGLAGALLGTLGQELHDFLSPRWGYLLLQGGAALLLVATGLYLAGWFPRFALVERLGQPLWRRLEPLGRRLIPVRSPWRAAAYGVIWGWLPCGLVYTALLFTIVSGNGVQGGVFMLVFGLGTLPAVTGIGMLAERFRRAARSRGVRRAGGLALILLGLGGLLFADGSHAVAPIAHEQQEAQCR
jgi:sulfite exporter TauE/SafE